MRPAKAILMLFALILFLPFFTPVAAAVEGNAVETCRDCHQKETTAHATSVHSANGCVACHTDITGAAPHEGTTTSHKAAVEKSCRVCHDPQAMSYESSVHGSGGRYEGLACATCHGSHDIVPSDQPSSKVNAANVNETCGQCHRGRVVESYRESFHGRAFLLGSVTAPNCVGCHGSHQVKTVSDGKGNIDPAVIPEMCANCHQEPLANFSAGYEHTLLQPGGPGAPRYWVLKFFAGLTILVVGGQILHIQTELFGLFRRGGNKKTEATAAAGSSSDKPEGKVGL